MSAARIEHRVTFESVVFFDPPVATTLHAIGRDWGKDLPFVVRRARISGPWDGKRRPWNSLSVVGARVKKNGDYYEENTDYSLLGSEQQNAVIALLGLADAIQQHRRVLASVLSASGPVVDA